MQQYLITREGAMTEIGKLLPLGEARCRQCGSTVHPMAQVSVRGSTAVFLCSTCETAYRALSTSLTPSSERRWSRHPLMTWARTESPPVGYIRSTVPPTDSWGWMPRST